jgi:5-methylcytosine-specific restriction protein A
MPDHRSPEAAAWRHLYKSSAWRKGRLVFLRENPLCERCQGQGQVTAATVVNHRVAHKGDLALFHAWTNWQALCAHCHDADVQQEERRGYSTRIGVDGWPVDPSHPANR